MDTDDLTIHVLREIRDEIRGTNTRVDTLTGRVDTLTHRVDRLESSVASGFEAVGQRITESEIRTATAINGLAGTLHAVHGLLRDQLDLRPRVERCERDIEDLRGRLG